MRRTVVSMLAGLLAVGGVTLAKPAVADNGWVGVYTQEITPELREGLNYNGSGALVRRVVADSPAERGGIERGDVIVRVGARGIGTPDELADIVRESSTDSPIDVVVVRDGSKKTLSVTLSSHAESPGNDDFDTPTPPPVPRMQHGAPETPEAPEAPEAPEGPEAPGRQHVRSYVRHFGNDGSDGEGDMVMRL